MTTTRAAAPAATSQPKASPENASPAKKPPFSRMAYTAEYKEAAVSLVLVNKMSIAEAANNLGISAQTLRNWIKMRQAGGELAVFVKILQKNWLGVFLSLKNLSRGFAPTLRYPRIFF